VLKGVLEARILKRGKARETESAKGCFRQKEAAEGAAMPFRSWHWNVVSGSSFEENPAMLSSVSGSSPLIKVFDAAVTLPINCFERIHSALPRERHMPEEKDLNVEELEQAAGGRNEIKRKRNQHEAELEERRLKNQAEPTSETPDL
jgi:hypothetical protein